MLSESQNIEYKESWRDEYLKWICGFANAQGGTLYIGITDKKEVCGVSDADKLMEDIPNKVRDILGIVVDVNLMRDVDKCYISISVPVSSVPLTFRGKYYYRTGSTLQELGGPALNDFIMRKMNVAWDTSVADDATLDDIDIEAVKYFVQRAVNERRLDNSAMHDEITKILKNIEVMTPDGKLTFAALMLFGKKIEHWCMGSDFRIGRFGQSASELITQDSISCPLILMPERIMDVLRSKYLVSPIHYEGLERKEPLEIPEDALREILCNAIVHRNMLGAHTQMKIMNDRITLWNDGTLPPSYTVETLMEEHESRPRNRLIAKAFYLAGFIETWGRGYDKIRADFLKAGLLVPTYQEVRGGFLVTIKRQYFISNVAETPHIVAESEPILAETGRNVAKTGRDLAETSQNVAETSQNVAESEPTVAETSQKVAETGSDQKLTPRQKKILKIISENPKLNVQQVSELTGISVRTLGREYALMQKMSVIKREGTYAGHWKIIIPLN